EEALRIGRILAELAPREPEVHGLVALMEIQASRLRARTGANGEPILLMEQSRALWDRLLIHRGLLALARGEALGEARGPYLLPGVRGDLLARLGRYEEAGVEFERAATLTHNARESRLLLDRAAACRRGRV